MGTLHEGQIIPLSVLLRMRNVSHKSYKQNEQAHFIFSNVLFRKWCLL